MEYSILTLAEFTFSWITRVPCDYALVPALPGGHSHTLIYSHPLCLSVILHGCVSSSSLWSLYTSLESQACQCDHHLSPTAAAAKSQPTRLLRPWHFTGNISHENITVKVARPKCYLLSTCYKPNLQKCDLITFDCWIVFLGMHGSSTEGNLDCLL